MLGTKRTGPLERAVAGARIIAGVLGLLALSACTLEPTRADIPERGSRNVVVHCSDFDDPSPFDAPAASHFAWPTAFRNDTVAQDIARSRLHVDRMRRCYQFLGDHAGKRGPWFDVPLIGTALVGAGAILYGANMDVVGGAGLAAGGLSAGKLYYHPSANQQAYLQAEKQLMCIYDQTHTTRFSLAGDILKNDRLALEAVMASVNDAAGPLFLDQDSQDLSPREKAMIKAAQDALATGKKTLEALDAALADYVQTPSTIYDSADKVDFAARDSTRLSITYADAVSTIQSSINTTLQNKSTVADARAALLKAQASTGDATKTNDQGAKAPKDEAGKAKKKKKQDASDALLGRSKVVAPVLTAPHTSCAADDARNPNHCMRIAVSGRQDQGGDEYHLRAFDVLEDTTTSLISKLLDVSETVLNDLPQPAFSEVRTNVAKCVISGN